MALLIREKTASDGSIHEVYGSRTGKVYFSGSKDQCEKNITNRKRNHARRMRDDAMRSIGLVKVSGNMGGTYWE